MKKIKRLAIIPARSGSQRIKNKNIKIFHNKPIISYSIKTALKSKLFKKIHVSTESKKIKKVVKSYGLNIDFFRPKSLSRDHTPLSKVMNYVTNKYLSAGEFFDEVWLIYPCSPLIESKDLIKAKKIIDKTNKKYPLMSFREYDAPIEWAFKENKGVFKPKQKKKLSLDSKKIPKHYYESASFIIYSSSHILKNKNFIKFFGYILPKTKAVDIDDIEDWKLLEKLFT